MKRPFFSRYSLIILMAVFFLAPFALRGARMAVQNMKNDVKDWLPSDFTETQELDWFREHFIGEQFVVISWEQCTGKDEKFKTFVDKFFPEVPPSIQRIRERATVQDESLPADSGNADAWPVEVRRQDFIDKRTGMYIRQLRVGDLPPEDEFIGNQLGLRYQPEDYFNWGGEQEKWIRGKNDHWYYLLPNGDLYQWNGRSNVIQPFKTAFAKMVGDPLKGQYIASLGEFDGPWYYADPRRLNARLFKTLMTGPGALHDLTKPGGSLSDDPEAALQRLAGSLFGPNGEQTCLIATLTDTAKQNLRSALGRGILGKQRGAVFDIAEESGISPPRDPQLLPPPVSWVVGAPPIPTPPTIKLGGPPIDNVAIDEEGQITLFRLIGLSVFVGVGLSWLSFRSVYITTMVFFVGGISATASLSFVYWGGTSVDAVLMSMPSLVYVLGLSGAVHIINYYGESVGEVGLRRAADRAIQLGWKPCTLAALTTSLGLLSLYASNILPIRKFGLFSAIGVMATLFLLFTYLPAALQTWPPRRFLQGSESHMTPTQRIVEAFWLRFGKLVVRYNLPVAIGCLISMIVIGYGLSRIKTDVQLLKMFDSGATIIGDYKWLEQNLGKLVPMEVVVRVEPSAMRSALKSDQQDGEVTIDDIVPLTFLERMEITSYIQEVLDRRLGKHGDNAVGQAMLAATFAPELPKSGGGFRNIAFRGGFNKQLESNRDQFLSTDFLRLDNDDDAELWRISLRLGALNDTDYGVFVNDLKQSIEPVLSAYKYREQILRTLSDQNKSGGIRNSHVYLVGAPFGGDPKKLRQASSSNQADADAAKTAEKADAGVSQTKVFASVLGRLLRNAGLDIRSWHDPRYELPDDWEAELADKDCVVLIDADNNYDVESLKAHANSFVDASGHIYDAANGTANEREQSIAAVYTGLVPVVYKAQRTLLISLIESTGWAFGMIAVVMMFVVRSVRAGLLSMLPNVYPVITVFGAMGWLGIAVDIGSMMTASVAMGVAVDDTIHFLTWFRRGLDEGRSRNDSISLAYRRVGLAMTQTTLIGGFGLAVFAFSTFTPTQRFGTLMLALLGMALIGDLVFLPSLLASRLGSVFGGRRGESKAPASQQQSPVDEDRSHRSIHQSEPIQSKAQDRSKWARGRASRGDSL